MASNSYISVIAILLLFFTSSSFAVSPSTICMSTPNPTFCKSILPPSNNQNAYDYGRSSLRKSLSEARKFTSLVDTYLTTLKPTLTMPTIRALEDCKFLADLNIDFLSTTYRTVNSTNRLLPVLKAEEVQSILSAILTNQVTCLDSLQSISSAGSVKNGLLAPISNDTKLYTVSLALVTENWVPNTFPRKRKLLGFQNNRKLLQFGGGSVLVYSMVTVSLDGTGDFTTINDAVNACPNNTNGSKGYFQIYVTAGVYEENVSVAKNKKYLIIVGDGINQTIITGSRSVADGWTTFNSATFAVVSPNFVMANITIRNTAGAIKHQAVALRSGADLSTFYRCSFEGYQDTLYTHSLRQFYKECDIYGTVDFIFGNAAVVLQNCNIYPRLPMSGQFNAITAQGRTDPNQNTGTSIHNCNIMAAPDLALSNGTTKTYLGRPWKQYSRTVYMQTFMDGLIDPAGWREWNGDFALSTLDYAEYSNSGPGSDTSGRVTWAGYRVIGATDAANFSVSNFILGDNWLPQTGVPYSGNL